MKPKISVISPTVRIGGLDMLRRCLAFQTFTEFEWIICSNRFDFWTDKTIELPYHVTLIADPPKRPGDFYSLNKSWNECFRQATGDLLLSIVDLTWIPPDCLEKFWTHYRINPKLCISAIGHQYKKVVNGRPEQLVWRDPRARTDQGTFYRVGHLEMELCCTSFPRRAVLEVGGIEEEFDKGAALSEKEMMLRMTYKGYHTYLDQTNEYRALYHPRLSEDWDKHYLLAQEMYNNYAREIIEGKRLKLSYL